MSVLKAKNLALSAQNVGDTDRKLDYIAKAIFELARTIGDIEDDVRRIKKAS